MPSLADTNHIDPCANPRCREMDRRCNMVPVVKCRGGRTRGRFCLRCARLHGYDGPDPVRVEL